MYLACRRCVPPSLSANGLQGNSRIRPPVFQRFRRCSEKKLSRSLCFRQLNFNGISWHFIGVCFPAVSFGFHLRGISRGHTFPVHRTRTRDPSDPQVRDDLAPMTTHFLCLALFALENLDFDVHPVSGSQLFRDVSPEEHRKLGVVVFSGVGSTVGSRFRVSSRALLDGVCRIFHVKVNSGRLRFLNG